MKNHEGFWKKCQHNRLYAATNINRQVAAHVGIDRHTATASEAIFYTLEAMVSSDREKVKPHKETVDNGGPGQLPMEPSDQETIDLHGWVMGNEQALDALKQLLQKDNCISVGHHRTRGYGDIRLQLESESNEPLCTDAWSQWSKSLIHFLDKPSFDIAGPGLNTAEDFYFSLSFPTGAVLVDLFLRYTLDPAAVVQWLPPISPPECALSCRPVQPLKAGEAGGIRWIAAMTRHERLRGWNAAHGLPRQDEWMVARGSVYVYHFHGTAEQRARLVERLVCLHQDGVGLRRNEGFGMVNVSHDFHRHFSSATEEREG